MRDIDYVMTTWGVDAPLLRQVRRAVFIVEQGVSEADEWDDEDDVCAHVLATANREPVGTGRLTPGGKIGRLAVLSEHRGRGIGERILTMLVQEAAHRGLDGVYLHAQVQALPFYRKLGFVAEGEEFHEAGIPHLRMRRATG